MKFLKPHIKPPKSDTVNLSSLKFRLKQSKDKFIIKFLYNQLYVYCFHHLLLFLLTQKLRFQNNPEIFSFFLSPIPILFPT